MDVPTWRTKFVTAKCEIALALSRGEAGGGYAEAVILLSSVLAALSADLWPGRKNDRARFIELLVRMSTNTPSFQTISVPLLIQELEKSGMNTEVSRLKDSLLSSDFTLVVTGSDVDRAEREVLSISPLVPREAIRKYSYACLLYEELRSSYAHEYRPGDRADSLPMTTRPNQAVSYVNNAKHGKRIHFHIEWLATVVLQIVKNVDSEHIESLSNPSAWWIHQPPPRTAA